MSELWINNRTTASVSMADVMSLASKFTKPEPIMAFQGTANELALAIQAERPPVNPLLWSIRPPDLLFGLDVVEEDGWTYIGTTSQLAEARKRWGSLSAARCMPLLPSGFRNPSPTPPSPACDPSEGEVEA